MIMWLQHTFLLLLVLAPSVSASNSISDLGRNLKGLIINGAPGIAWGDTVQEETTTEGVIVGWFEDPMTANETEIELLDSETMKEIAASIPPLHHGNKPTTTTTTTTSQEESTEIERESEQHTEDVLALALGSALGSLAAVLGFLVAIFCLFQRRARRRDQLLSDFINSTQRGDNDDSSLCTIDYKDNDELGAEEFGGLSVVKYEESLVKEEDMDEIFGDDSHSSSYASRNYENLPSPAKQLRGSGHTPGTSARKSKRASNKQEMNDYSSSSSSSTQPMSDHSTRSPMSDHSTRSYGEDDNADGNDGHLPISDWSIGPLPRTKRISDDKFLVIV